MSDEHTDPRQADARQAAPVVEQPPGDGPAADAPEEDLVDAATAPASDAEVVDAEMDSDALRVALTEAVRQRDEYLDQAQRNRAEYLNLKRRSEEQLAAALDRGAERLLAQLLGVLDNLGYLVDAAAQESQTGDETALAKGVSMVSGELFDVLGATGLEAVPGDGAPFDPRVHEALLSEESAEPLDEPVVTEILRRGWQFKGRVLRPASVKVAR